jgi:hypothetical protein
MRWTVASSLTAAFPASGLTAAIVKFLNENKLSGRRNHSGTEVSQKYKKLAKL